VAVAIAVRLPAWPFLKRAARAISITGPSTEEGDPHAVDVALEGFHRSFHMADYVRSDAARGPPRTTMGPRTCGGEADVPTGAFGAPGRA
jgi:hypothetical protein